jgi:hypothetical protein
MSVAKRITASGMVVPFDAVVTGVNLESGSSVTLRAGSMSGPIFAAVTQQGTVQALPRVFARKGVYAQLGGTNPSATIYYE